MKNTKGKIVLLATVLILFFGAIIVISRYNAYAVSTTVVTPGNPNGWWFLQETATGSGTFVYGPYGPSISEPPLGGGSAQLTIDGTGGEIFGTFAFVGTRLDAITSLAYSTYRSSGSSALAPSLQLDIDTDVTDTNTAWQGRLVYEPYYTHTVTTGAWQTWNPLDNAGTGNWWFTGAPGNAVCTLNNPCTWSEVLAHFPNAGIRSAGTNTGALQFKAGGGWTSGFIGSVDAFSIGVNGTVATYDFELPFTVPAATLISPSSKFTTDSAFTLTLNGTNFFPSSVVQWNGSNRSTTFVSSTRLTASILSSDIIITGTFPITVVNPAPGGGTSNSQTFTITSPVSSVAYTAWTDHGVGYVAPTGSAYYPSAIYDANGFGVGNPKYKMWYSDGNGSLFLVTSTDGVTWGAPTTMAGIGNVHHAQILYDVNCFGVVPCDSVAIKYKIWFWDMGAPTIYSISSMATAESVDGINWINKTAVTQNSGAKLVQSPDSGTGWNRGTYGPVNVFYQPNANNTGIEPWNYKYVMYYDGTDGGHEGTGLAYSIDGLNWSAYTVNPVLSGSSVGVWDCISAAYGTVFKDFAGYHFFYSGKGQDDGSGGCVSPASNNFDGIGYAFSVDGRTWVKDTNPIFKISDGVSYRSGRIYTPSVINDNSGILRMYFSATDATDATKKIGYATLITPVTPVSPPAQTSSVPEGTSGTSPAPASALFSGQAYPGSTFQVLRKLVTTPEYEGVSITNSTINSDGTFSLLLQYFPPEADYLFSVQAKDKDGKSARIITFSHFVKNGEVYTVNDILIPPTIDLKNASITKGKLLMVIGYAAPKTKVEVMADDVKLSEVQSDSNGYYGISVPTDSLDIGEHSIKTRYILVNGKTSDFSFSKSVTISGLFYPEADLNGDGKVNIADWSIFLFRWSSKVQNMISAIDLNGDGKVDITDFGIFLNLFKF